MGTGFSSVWGVERGDGWICVIRASRSWGRVVFQTVYAGAPEGGAWASVRAGLLKTLSRPGNAVSDIMPALHWMARRIEVPVKSRARAGRVLPAQWDVHLPFPLETCRHFFTDFARTDTGWSALAVAAQDSALATHCAGCEKALCEPWAEDPEAWAAWIGAREEALLPERGPALISVLGSGRWMLAAGRDGALISVFAGRAPAAEDFSGWQALASEWATKARRAADTLAVPGPATWVWAGCAAAHAETLQAFQAALADSGARHITADAPALFLARSTARRMLRPGEWRTQLRIGPMEASPVSRFRARAQFARHVGAGVAGILLAVSAIGVHAALEHRISSLDTRIAKEVSDLTGLSRVPKDRESEVAREKMEQRLTEAAPLLLQVSAPASRMWAGVLAAAAKQGTRIERMEWNGRRLVVEGAGVSVDAARAVENALAAEGWATSLKTDEGSGAERIRFRIEGNAP